MLMLPTRDLSLLAGGAAVLDGAALAGVRPVAMQDQPVFLVREMAGEPFTGWARRDSDLCAVPSRPNFCAKLGGIVNADSLIKLSCEIGHGGQLCAKLICDSSFGFAERELNADLQLRW